MRYFEKCTCANENTKLPERSTSHSAGYDFYSPVSVAIGPGQSGMVKTNIKARMDKNDVLMIFPRSSMGIKRHVMLSNTVGIIDSDYYNNAENEGNIIISLHNYGDRILEIKPGEKIAQGILVKFAVTDDDKAEGTRVGGIGSTGK